MILTTVISYIPNTATLSGNCAPPPTRTDIENWNEGYADELNNNLKLPPGLDPELRDRVIDIIKAHWDAFFERGVRRPILRFEFCIDTGASPPVCCRLPNYGPHESKIIQKQVDNLYADGLITECEGPWGSSIVLAPKPHQENVTDIRNFVWRMCVSYRRLNAITRPFTYPIPRCMDAIENLGDAAGKLFFLSLDARQGFHQIAVNKRDQEKLAFFSPNMKKYTFTVLPFGPMNGPPCYTAMMRSLKDEWEDIFHKKNEHIRDVYGSNTIIDDILAWSTCVWILLSYFECICIVLVQRRVSFRLDKCEFFKQHVEYVGHDLTPDGNCPAQSKFSLINDWPQPTCGSNLHSFLGLCTFYARYCPWLEEKATPFRTLVRKYRRKAIPDTECTPTNVELFLHFKRSITSSPCLARYDSSKICFLKTDWFAAGMGYVLMQPDDSPASQKALATMQHHQQEKTPFDIILTGARLRPILFGSRRCTDRERHFHSFVGETACGRWAIGQLKHYLWGAHFYWLTDCIALREILEYDGPLHQVRRWAQELLGYFFTIEHRPAAMMKDVDALSRMYDRLILEYNSHAENLRAADTAARPNAYSFMPIDALTSRLSPPTATPAFVTPPTPLLLTQTAQPFTTSPVRTISTSPAPKPSPYAHLASPNQTLPSLDTSTSITAATTFPTWISVNSALMSIAYGLDTGSLLFDVHFVDKDDHLERMYRNGLLPTLCSGCSFHHGTLRSFLSDAAVPHIVHGVDITCPHSDPTTQLAWLTSSLELLLHQLVPKGLQCFCLICPAADPTDSKAILSSHVAQQLAPQQWNTLSTVLLALAFGDATVSPRWICLGIRRQPHTLPTFLALQPTGATSLARTLLDCEDPALNTLTNAIATVPLHTYHEILLDRQPTAPLFHGPVPLWFCNPPQPPLTAHSHTILHPDHAGQDPDLSPSQGPFHPTYGYPFETPEGTIGIRQFSFVKVASTFSIPPEVSRAIPEHYHDIVLHRLASSLPFATATCIANCLLTHFQARLFDQEDDHVASDTTRCLLAKSLPPPTDWAAAYHADHDCHYILQHLPDAVWTEPMLRQVSPAYRAPLRAGHIKWDHHRGLIVHQPLEGQQGALLLIIVPETLRKDICTLYHANPIGGHLGRYTTLYRLRIRFFWPKMRSYVETFVAQCPHCILTNSTRRTASKLMNSWPIDSPFSVVHVDLWQSRNTTDFRGTTYLMNALCDMTQFVVSVPCSDIHAHSLARLFMQEVLLKVGFCAMVVVDDGTPFKELFRTMCTTLNIWLHLLAKDNHQALSVERFHRYLNKALTIATNDRGSNSDFVPAAMAAAYAWNSSPIDGTDIIRSIPAIGREFKFPFDFTLHPTPALATDRASSVRTYLDSTASNSLRSRDLENLAG